MFFKDFVSVKRQKIKRGASQTYDTPSYNIILNNLILYYIYSVPPETLNDLNDLDLNDRGTLVFECLFVV